MNCLHWYLLFGSRQIHFMTMFDKQPPIKFLKIHRKSKLFLVFPLVAYEQTNNMCEMCAAIEKKDQKYDPLDHTDLLTKLLFEFVRMCKSGERRSEK